MDGSQPSSASPSMHSAMPVASDLADWVGRSETTVGCVPAITAKTIQATLGRPGDQRVLPNNPMPALWHWYAFPPTVGMDNLSADGHPMRGGFLPPVPYERRMWAGGNLEFVGDLYVGEEIEKRSTIKSIDEKTGSTGGMVFVVVEHELTGGAGLAVRETQSIVYLPIPDKFAPPPRKPGPTENLVIDEVQVVSAPLLFRYSAITFNAHRIHYDLPYAREVEKYPGLVVHGPLQANLLLNAASVWKGKRPDRFSFRGVHPMFHDSALHLRATRNEDGSLDLCTVAAAGHRGMEAKAIWEE